jgi:hypothetical protein
MNKSVANRTITKQEAMCELGHLPMVICSESIEIVSIAGQTRCSGGNPNDNTTSTILSRYKKRPDSEEHLSLHQFYYATKNNRSTTTNNHREFVPHYVGGSGQPVFPINKHYARSEILKHMPWSQKNPLPNDSDWIAIFEEFVQKETCPYSVKIAYERAQLRYELKKRGIVEACQPDIEHSNPTDDLDDDEIGDVVALSESLGYTTNEIDNIEKSGIFLGKDYDWSKRIHTVSVSCMFGYEVLEFQTF